MTSVAPWKATKDNLAPFQTDPEPVNPTSKSTSSSQAKKKRKRKCPPKAAAGLLSSKSLEPPPPDLVLVQSSIDDEDEDGVIVNASRDPDLCLEEDEEEPLAIDSYSEASSLDGILQEPLVVSNPIAHSSEGARARTSRPTVAAAAGGKVSPPPLRPLLPSAKTCSSPDRQKEVTGSETEAAASRSSSPEPLQSQAPRSTAWVTLSTPFSPGSTTSSQVTTTAASASASACGIAHQGRAKGQTQPEEGDASSEVQRRTRLLQRLIMPSDVEADDDVYSYKPACGRKEKVYAVGSAVTLVVGIIVACLVGSLHKIEEGNVGIYFKHGALQDQISHPGVHWMAPFVTEMREVSVRPHTDTLSPIHSVTKDGIQNTFNEVQVISDVKVEHLIPLIREYGTHFKRALVFDRIREELRIFCANHTVDEVYNTRFLEIVNAVKRNTEESIRRLGNNGIELLNLAIPKPEIPPDISKNYKQVKVQWTEQLVATQQQRTEQIKKDTESLKAVADAKRKKAVLEIELQQKVMQKEGERNLSSLENEIMRRREESNADIDHYKKVKAAEANNMLFTKEYIQLETAKVLANNTKFYFSGTDSILGSLMNSIMSKN